MKAEVRMNLSVGAEAEKRRSSARRPSADARSEAPRRKARRVLDCGGKRSATPLWLGVEDGPLSGQRQKAEGKRRKPLRHAGNLRPDESRSEVGPAPPAAKAPTPPALTPHRAESPVRPRRAPKSRGNQTPRSAPVLGRSRGRVPHGSRHFPQPMPWPRGCARGRAHSARSARRATVLGDRLGLPLCVTSVWLFAGRRSRAMWGKSGSPLRSAGAVRSLSPFRPAGVRFATLLFVSSSVTSSPSIPLNPKP
jgi:hypothetical protein